MPLSMLEIIDENESLWDLLTLNWAKTAPIYDFSLFTIDYQSQIIQMGWFLHSVSTILSNYSQALNPTLQYFQSDRFHGRVGALY
jgi:hypothetical protein